MFPKYLKACESYISSNNKNIYQSAIVNNDGTFTFTDEIKSSDICLNRIDEMLKLGLAVSPLDIKSDYLYQLEEISLTVQDPKPLEDLELAKMSASITSLHISFNDLRHATETELAKCLSDPAALGRLISDKNLMQYGIHNAVAIRLQNPFAKKLFTSNDLSALNLSVGSVQKPIYIYTPIDKPYFMLEDKQIPLSDADLEQQIEISSGKIPIHHNVFYKAHKVYDISQLGLAKGIQHQLLQLENPPCTLEDITEFAKRTKISTKYAPTVGMNLKSYYENASNSIVINSNIHDDFKMSAYINALSAALIENTSMSPPTLMDIEKNILSLNLHSKLGQTLPQKLVGDICSLIGSYEPGSEFSLEVTLAKVNKAATFASKGIEKIAFQNIAKQEQAQNQNISQTKTQSKQQPLNPQKSDVLSNFLQEL